MYRQVFPRPEEGISIIDKESPLPLYCQLKDWLRELVGSGVLDIDDQVPPELMLCEELGLSRGTVRQAINELVNEGLLYRVQGHGTFVSGPKVEHSLGQRFTSLAEDMREHAIPFQSEVLGCKLLQAGERRATSKLQLSPSEQVVFLERLGRVEGEPIVLALTYLPAALCPGLLEEDLTDRSLYQVLEQKYGLKLDRAIRTLELAPADEYEAQWLNIQKGDPIHLMRTVAYLKGGRPIEYSKLRFRGDRSSFMFEVHRA
jgi:GntR family transcriptional regulator